jgi:NAD(P)-dependent dehydrogenase (short-subunit alcohol dehydrogenase family)
LQTGISAPFWPGLTDTGRVAEGLEAPYEIANAVVFLASDRARYATGVTIGMDGGPYPIVA